MRVQVTIGISSRTIGCGLAGLLIFIGAAELGSENVTLSTYYSSPAGVYTGLTTSGNAFLALNAGSSVGIGTTAPSAKLHVVGPASGSGATIKALGGLYMQTNSPLVFGDYASYATAGASINTIASPANTLVFRTSGAERMRLNSTGAVLIGGNVDLGGNMLLVVGSAQTTGADAGKGVIISREPNCEPALVLGVGQPNCDVAYPGYYPTWQGGFYSRTTALNGLPAGYTAICCPCDGFSCPSVP